MPSKPSSPETLKQLAAAITKLLQHYWTADDPQPARRAQIEDWIEDIREFPMPIVDAAIATWRRSESRRPTPADIRKLCIEEQSEQQFNALPRPNLTHDEIETKASHIANRWAQGQGFSSIDVWQNSHIITAQDLAVSVAPGVTRYFRKNRRSQGEAPVNLGAGIDQPPDQIRLGQPEFNPSQDQLAQARRELGIDAVEMQPETQRDDISSVS